ncbi:ABC transporter substrate-binding protein [Amycolatopsis thermoflava]|uniref:ABC transporter substrate-binding protein n=1 Tax=Amycolatopsis thermoflava TaxID=84480 RepID=UPI003801B595
MRHTNRASRWRSAAVLAAGLALVLSAAGCGSEPAAGGPHAVTFAGSPANTPVDALEPLAIAHGVYSRHGIDMNFTHVRSLSEAAAAVVGGSAQFGLLGTAAVAPLIQQGECFKFLTANQKIYYRLVARPGYPLPNAGAPYPASARDLKGAKIGVVGLGGIQEIVIKRMLAAAGLTPQDVTVVAVGGPATAVPAFQAGQVDMYMATPPAEQLLGSSGFEVVADFLADPALPSYGFVQTFTGASCDFVEENPQVVADFCAATAAAHQFIRDPANGPAVVAELASSGGTDQATAEQIWKQYGAVWTDGAITPEIWESQRLVLPPGVELPDMAEVVDPACQQTIKSGVSS